MNFMHLGLWLRRKFEACFVKLNEANKRIEDSTHTATSLRAYWAEQQYASANGCPSKIQVFLSLDRLTDVPCPAGASKVETTRFAHNLVGMLDSLDQTDALIQLLSNQGSSTSSSPFDLSLTLEELISMKNRLATRIKKDSQTLMGRDAVTARAIRNAMKSDAVMKKMKARAIRLQIRHKVKDVLMSAVPYKRRISRAKKGL